MGPKLKAGLWILTLLAIIHVSHQYRISQQARASAHTQHTSVSEIPKPLYRVTKIDGQTMRLNEATGETHFWSTEGGGWVRINETDLVTAVSTEERQARKSAIREWFDAIEVEAKKKLSYEAFEPIHIDTPSWEIREAFEKWKRKRAELHQTELKKIIGTWYKELTPTEQAVMPYEQYESKLLAVTNLEARLKVIRSWHELMDNAYKQRVSLNRFEAIEIQQPLANLQLAFAKQQKIAPTALPTSTAKLCPMCGNRFAAASETTTCPLDSTALELVKADPQSKVVKDSR